MHSQKHVDYKTFFLKSLIDCKSRTSKCFKICAFSSKDCIFKDLVLFRCLNTIKKYKGSALLHLQPSFFM